MTRKILLTLALAVVVGELLAWRRRRRAKSDHWQGRPVAMPATSKSNHAPGRAPVAEQGGPPPEDERVSGLRTAAAEGKLSADEQRFLRSEGVDVDPDRDPVSDKLGGKLGRGFWDEDRDRDISRHFRLAASDKE